MLRLVMLRQDVQPPDELLPRFRRERGEEFLLGVGDERVEAFQAAPTGEGERDDVAAAIGSGARRIRPASDSRRLSTATM
ncbi:hypothetical protein HUT11_00415 [Streptomyces seoulensis]|nr:hypothetical protein HUT11_00415 [Streptomyces seoulensis]